MCLSVKQYAYPVVSDSYEGVAALSKSDGP